LEFIKAKYWGREFGTPELEWYTDVERPLDPAFFGRFPFEHDEHDQADLELAVKEQMLAMASPKETGTRKKKRAVVKRLSISSSESDIDINEVLSEVVKDYVATHTKGG